jgi:hypothetical protein
MKTVKIVPRVGQVADYKQHRGCLITDVDEAHKKVVLIVPVNGTKPVTVAFDDITELKDWAVRKN